MQTPRSGVVGTGSERETPRSGSSAGVGTGSADRPQCVSAVLGAHRGAEPPTPVAVSPESVEEAQSDLQQRVAEAEEASFSASKIALARLQRLERTLAEATNAEMAASQAAAAAEAARRELDEFESGKMSPRRLEQELDLSR